MSHPYRSAAHKNDPKWLGGLKRADGGRLPNVSFAPVQDEDGGPTKYRTDFSTPISSNTDLVGSGSFTPNAAGPGRNDMGGRIGIRTKFKRGGKVTKRAIGGSAVKRDGATGGDRDVRGVEGDVADANRQFKNDDD